MPEDYFIGVHARELERLEDQHEAWRPETEALWEAADFGAGLKLADLGSGPGYTALDLAQRVGAAGSVVAIDNAAPCLAFLQDEAARRGVSNVATMHADIARLTQLPAPLHGAFCRFFLAFLIRDLDRVLGLVYESLQPAGVFAAMEYLTLESARSSPSIRGFDAHTRAWVDYYARHGGDTTVGSYLPARLERAGFEVVHAAHAGGNATPGSRWWKWWGRLIEDFGDRLVDERCMSATALEHLRHDWAAASTQPGASIRTPTLIRIVARKGRRE